MADTATLPQPLDEVAPPKGRHGGAAWAVWIARRLGLAVLTLWLVSVLVFFATAALGDPVRAILGDKDQVEQAVAVEISGADMLAVMDGAAQRAFHPTEPALAVVQVKPVGAILDRQRGVEVAIAVEIAEHRIQRVQLGRGGDVGGGGVGKGRTGARLRQSRAGEKGGGENGKDAHGFLRSSFPGAILLGK